MSESAVRIQLADGQRPRVSVLMPTFGQAHFIARAARIATMIAAGLPLIQHDNASSIVATQSLARELDIGLFFRNAETLAGQLRDASGMERLRANVWRQRPPFTFDHHADRLVEFFRRVIAREASR